MRKIKLLLLIILVFVLVACNGNNENIKSNNEAGSNEEEVDFTGAWIDKEAEGEDFLAGYIENDRIEIYWMSDQGVTSSLYWSGTYGGLEKEGKDYYWESMNDKTRTEYAMLASIDDTKKFTINKNELTFELTFMEQTVTIEMIPTNETFAGFEYLSESADTSSLAEIQLNDSGYYIHADDGFVTVYYAVEIENLNDEHAIIYPKISITARDNEDKILGTQEDVLFGVAAGENYKYGSQMFFEGEKPESVDITVSNASDSYQAQSSSGIVPSENFTISNVSEMKGEYDTTFTGEVENNSTKDMDMMAIVVIYKANGKIIGGETTYIDNLKSGDKQPFQIDNYDDIDYDSYEILAIPW